jgi:ABC-type Co2+ transport system permease subunit
MIALKWWAIPYVILGAALIAWWSKMERKYNPNNRDFNSENSVVRVFVFISGVIIWPIVLAGIVLAIPSALRAELADRKRHAPPNRNLTWMKRLFGPPHSWR